MILANWFRERRRRVKGAVGCTSNHLPGGNPHDEEDAGRTIGGRRFVLAPVAVAQASNAETTPPADEAAADEDDGNDDSSEVGLWGLLGLAGLVGWPVSSAATRRSGTTIGPPLDDVRGQRHDPSDVRLEATTKFVIGGGAGA